ncbi:hypothetical protein IQ238_27515 [Pleurocapsales cyanobacterium LEGE 06147]|nr:hypothetical protein [Pleurocapsales cyanobacterium LEGE 06147]
MRQKKQLNWWQGLGILGIIWLVGAIGDRLALTGKEIDAIKTDNRTITLPNFIRYTLQNQ